MKRIDLLKHPAVCKLGLMIDGEVRDIKIIKTIKGGSIDCFCPE
jgi:hypothetical protein